MQAKGKNLTYQVLFIFIFSFIVRMGLFAFYQIKSPQCFLPYIDSFNYINRANGLLNYGMIGVPPYPDVYWTPIYSMFISLVYFLTSSSNIEVIIIQLVLSSISCCMLYLIALKVLSKRVAFIVSLILAIDLPTVGFANTIMSETLFVFWLMIFVWTFMLFLEKGKVYFLILSGLAAGLGILTRPILYYFIPFSIIVFAYYFKGKYKKGLFYFAIFTLAALTIIGPWIYRNSRLGYNGIAAVQDSNIYYFKAGWIEQKVQTGQVPTHIDTDSRANRVNEIIAQRGMENTPYNRIKIYKEFSKKTITQYPYLLAEYQARYTLQVYTSLGVNRIFENIPIIDREKFNQTLILTKYLYGIILIITYITFTIGAVSHKSWNRGYGIFFVLILLAYLTALSGEWGGGSRFRAPLMPLILLISGVGLEKIASIVETFKIRRNNIV